MSRENEYHEFFGFRNEKKKKKFKVNLKNE